MRIAFFVPWITKGRGGTENVGQMMANAMARRGHQVEILTFDDARQPSRWPLEPSIRLTHLAEAESDASDQQLAMEVARGNPDLIVGLHMNRTFRRYVRCAHRLGLPLVLSEHIDPRFPARMKTFDPALREVVMSGATRIHLLVEAFRPSLPDCLQDRVRVIHNTVPPARRIAEPGVAGAKTVLTVARLVPRKNIARLIDAFAAIAREMPDWTLRIVGDGEQTGELKARAAMLGLAERVDFAGHAEDAYPFYETAHLFVLPSIFEGFPMCSLEAMAHGLPVIGYRICNGLNIQVENGVNGILSSGGQAMGSLAGDMLQLMRDDEARARMGAASLERFDTLYGNKVVFDAWEALFREAIEAGGTGARPSRAAYLSVKLDDLVWGENQMIAPVV
jgi:glycosyltransferase involved in cell wall biosynthesis